jgi:hypothetical protein
VEGWATAVAAVKENAAASAGIHALQIDFISISPLRRLNPEWIQCAFLTVMSAGNTHHKFRSQLYPFNLEPHRA